jgi:hypothetical protein
MAMSSSKHRSRVSQAKVYQTKSMRASKIQIVSLVEIPGVVRPAKTIFLRQTNEEKNQPTDAPLQDILNTIHPPHRTLKRA